MLHLNGIRKTYQVGSFSQAALDSVTLTFRDNEFVAVLGPSGSGKTTLLNIVGGLDHYDSGDLAIDQVSTSKYTDRDWDAYRNNRIGFVFQSYNLIPHQSVLANVELALTLSGVNKAERTQRARTALDQVGLSEHIHKVPSQLSGGQMQRVAIARALINDPEILLADEPTGALDSKTSVQVMNLLQGIARDRLVVMVTHNPELAEQYANRIISLKDGRVVADTRPYAPDTTVREARPTRRTSMSFLTAIALSFTNLMTKKGRTLMTSFAGSIGIIGIAAILAIANGVNAYIRSVEEDTLSLYPLSIQTQGIDLAGLLTASTGSDTSSPGDDTAEESESPEQTVREASMVSRMFSGVGSNDLTSLKAYLDSPKADIEQYVNAIQYAYDITPQIFAADTSHGIRQVNPNTAFSALGLSSTSSTSMISSMGMSVDVFDALPDDMDLLTSQYDLVAGIWPEGANECLLVLTGSGRVFDLVAYSMGLRDPDELDQMVQDMAENKPIEVPGGAQEYTYEELLDVEFRVIPSPDYYKYDSTYHVWTDMSDDKAWMTRALANGEPLNVVGIIQPRDVTTTAMLNPGLYYTPDLVYHLMDEAESSPIVNDQRDAPELNIFSGKTFQEEAENPTMADFDFSSLVSIDSAALSELFALDASGLSLDLPAMDFSSLAGQMPSVAPPDLVQMLSGLDVQVSPEAVISAISDTLGEYLDEVYDVSLDTPPPGTPPTGLPTTAPTGETTTEPPSTSPSASSSPSPDPSGPAETPSAGVTGAPSPSPTPTPAIPSETPTSLPTELPTELPSVDLPTPTEVVDSFSVWFAQPDVQARLATRVLGSVNSAELQQQVSLALGGYMEQTMQTVLQAMMESLESQLTVAMGSAMTQVSSQLSQAMSLDPAMLTEAFTFTMDPAELTSMLMSMMTNQTNSLESNLRILGYASTETPSSIDIYPKDFQSKQAVLDILDSYNQRMKDTGEDDKVITYTDIVGTLMSSVTDIISKVSSVLVAFVSISLVVSSIMIGVITYISVLERKKEIGILRALGASKRDIGNVFNAETLIVGFVAGLMGVLITIGLTLIANPIVYSLFEIEDIARLPLNAALALIAISMVLTFLAGLIPSSAASRKDPVEALRSE